jgi:predicted nucleic acid-binding protein
LIVLDTSAVVEFLVGADTLGEKVRAVSVGERLAAPHAVDLECASTLRGLVRRAKLPADEARRALDLLGIIKLKRYDRVPPVATHLAAATQYVAPRRGLRRAGRVPRR